MSGHVFLMMKGGVSVLSVKRSRHFIDEKLCPKVQDRSDLQNLRNLKMFTKWFLKYLTFEP